VKGDKPANVEVQDPLTESLTSKEKKEEKEGEKGQEDLNAGSGES
jgi:hypothetical protein